MDNLTHTLTGIMLARAGAGRSVPRAGLLMAMAANAPDVDIASWFGGTATYLDYHRGITHSLTLSAILALLPVAIVWSIERKRLPWVLMWVWSLTGVLSHLALDWTNAYGIRLLLPFSRAWLRLDTVYIVDLAIWAILLLGVAAPALARLVSSEIGAKPASGTGWAVAMLCLLGVYEFSRYLAHERAIAALEARIYDGSPPVRVAAFAKNAIPWIWMGVVETRPGYIIFNMNLREEFDPGGGRTLYKADPSPAIETARGDRNVQALERFSSYPLWRTTAVPEPASATKVELFDLRFGAPAEPGLQAIAIVDSNGAVLQSRAGFGRLQPK